MKFSDPLKKSKKEYQETIDVIRSEAAAVGIDAQYTHAIIIDFLKQISARLDQIEEHLSTTK